ncbi:MAG: alpha-galactosidase [Clostridia bacterium]|nr:alpha-galactosidase [Clostridia bacterium]
MIRQNAAEQQRAQAFLQALCEAPPFLFSLDGEPVSAGPVQVSRHEAADRTEAVVSRRFGDLVAEVRAVLWARHPAVEWTVWLRNIGEADSPLISDWRAFDGVLAPEMTSNHPGINHTYVLQYFRGDYYSPDGFEQFDRLLSNDIPLTFHNEGGRSCSTELPYYRLRSDKRAIAIAVSWQGQWQTSFRFNWQQGVYFSAAQARFHGRLHPGEAVRSPLIALLFSESPDDARCVNLWRHWMIDCNIPRQAGGQPLPVCASFGSNAYFYECRDATEENQLFFVGKLLENQVPFDIWWMDAMWYDCGSRRLPNWCPVGTWRADPERFPHGLTPISSLLHANGKRLLAWFEPERVSPGTEIYEKYPQFTLTTPQAESPAIQQGAMGTDTNASIDNSRLLNLADPQVLRYITDTVSDAIRDNGIDWYRQDMNTNPLRVWIHNETPERVGVLENLYCQNLLRYWDTLRERFPDVWQDTCASGGRRIELETLRRAVPLCKSDYNAVDPCVTAAFHHSLYQWVPYFASLGMRQTGTLYELAVHMALFIGVSVDVRQPQDYDRLNRFLLAYKQLAPYVWGDYYEPLGYTRDPRLLTAYQFDRPEQADGLLGVIAHDGCRMRAAALPLQGVDPAAVYRVRELQEDFSWGPYAEMSGAQLAAGYPVAFAGGRQAHLVQYGKKA